MLKRGPCPAQEYLAPLRLAPPGVRRQGPGYHTSVPGGFSRSSLLRPHGRLRCRACRGLRGRPQFYVVRLYSDLVMVHVRASTSSDRDWPRMTNLTRSPSREVVSSMRTGSNGLGVPDQ